MANPLAWQLLLLPLLELFESTYDAVGLGDCCWAWQLLLLLLLRVQLRFLLVELLLCCPEPGGSLQREARVEQIIYPATWVQRLPLQHALCCWLLHLVARYCWQPPWTQCFYPLRTCCQTLLPVMVPLEWMYSRVSSYWLRGLVCPKHLLRCRQGHLSCLCRLSAHVDAREVANRPRG